MSTIYSASNIEFGGENTGYKTYRIVRQGRPIGYDFVLGGTMAKKQLGSDTECAAVCANITGCMMFSFDKELRNCVTCTEGSELIEMPSGYYYFPVDTGPEGE
jgi:hypothetical protein